MANHDFSAFQKNVSSEEQQNISSLSEKIIKKINSYFNVSIEEGFQFLTAKIANTEKVKTPISQIIQFNSQLSLFLDSKATSTLVNVKSGGSIKSNLSMASGVLGEETSLFAVKEIIEKILGSKCENLESKIYNSLGEWQLHHPSKTCFFAKFESSLLGTVIIALDPLNKDKFISMLKSLNKEAF